MSVLIKDMEMPETCDDCPFHVYHSHYEYVCKATPMFYPMNLANSKGIRKDFCPLEEVPECEDAISRQAAIDALDKRFDNVPMEQTAEILKLRKDLRELPSIQSEQKRGRWIYGEDEYGIDGYHCDKCGFFVPWDYTHKFINYIEDYNFCPSCGADMRGEQNGTD